MIDISPAVKELELAYTGELVRKALINALNSLNGALTTDDTVKVWQLFEHFRSGYIGYYPIFETTIDPFSNHPVRSDALYNYFGDLKSLLGEVEDIDVDTLIPWRDTATDVEVMDALDVTYYDIFDRIDEINGMGGGPVADITKYTNEIRNAPRGEIVRDSIINALNKMNVERHPIQLPELLSVFQEAKINGTPIYDPAPTPDSTRAVESKGVYDTVHDIELLLDEINGEVV